jgi:hypothetical protein
VNFWISFLAGVILMGLNLAGLAFITSRLGRGARARAYVGYAALWFVKMAVLATAVILLVRSPYFQFAGLFLGLGIPVVALAIWQLFDLGKNRSKS